MIFKNIFKILFITILISLLLPSCNRDEPQGYDIFYNNVFEIPAGLNTIETHIIRINDISPNINDFLPDGIQEEDLVSITPKSIRLISQDGTLELGFVERAFLRIETDDLSEKEVGYREIVPENTNNILDLVASLGEMKDYLNAPRFDLMVRFNFRIPPPEFIPIRLEVVFLGRTE